MRKFKFTPPPSTKNKESALLKYTAIVMMALGGANFVLSIGGLFDIPTVAWYETYLGNPDPTATLMTSGILAIIIGLIEFITGLFGYLRREKRKKMQLCIILGFVSAAAIVVLTVYRLSTGSLENAMFSLIELIPTALYLWGAFEWKNRK